MKLHLETEKRDATSIRSSLLHYYRNKYYNIFMNNYKFGEKLDYQQKEYILKQYWAIGTISSFKLEGTEGSSKHPQGLLVFCPYSADGWNIYDFPTSVHLINTKGVSFIDSSKAMIVDKDVVLGWAQRNHKSVKEFVYTKIEQIVDVEMVIYCNLNVHKMPWIFSSSIEMEKKMKDLADKLRSDEPELFVSGDEGDMIKALVSGAPFIIDKLHDYKASIENELREYLGLNSLGISEKKEHLITSEVEVNDEVVESSGNCFLDCIKEFFGRIKEVFGIEISVELNKVESENQDITKKDVEVEEDDE